MESGAGRPAGPPGLHILFLDSWRSEAWDGSGTAVGIAGLRRGLEDLGHRVEVLRPAGSSSPGLVQRLAYNFRLSGRLCRRVDRGGWGATDLIVGFDLDGFRWSTARRRRRNAPPYLVSLKGVAADEARFATSKAEALHLRVLAALEKRNSRSADAVLVPSRYSAGVVERLYGIPGNRIHVVPEAVDIVPFQEVIPEPPPVPTILSVARQYPRKDTKTLLRALPSVRERVPNVHLRVIGGGPELENLRALALELKVAHSVTFQGAVPEDEEVRRAYGQAHVFSLPSLQEGFGIAFVEAMAAGLPVVAARAGAVPEVVEDGETGLLVPPGDPEALAEALTRLLDEEEGPARRRRLGDAGRERARRFIPPRAAERFLAVVRGVARPGKPGVAGDGTRDGDGAGIRERPGAG